MSHSENTSPESQAASLNPKPSPLEKMGAWADDRANQPLRLVDISKANLMPVVEKEWPVWSKLGFALNVVGSSGTPEIKWGRPSINLVAELAKGETMPRPEAFLNIGFEIVSVPLVEGMGVIHVAVKRVLFGTPVTVHICEHGSRYAEEARYFVYFMQNDAASARKYGEIKKNAAAKGRDNYIRMKRVVFEAVTAYMHKQPELPLQ